MSTVIQPTTAQVNTANVYRNIITNFADPLECVREAISNSVDASASKISLRVDLISGPTGQPEVLITVTDNGDGMDQGKLERFFNLGDSEKTDLKQNDGGSEHLIGEKGFGTKIFLNSREIRVKTTCRKSKKTLFATCKNHLERICNSEAPQYDVREVAEESGSGTEIKIYGYNHNDASKFGHDQLRDYILWFTKFGSFETKLWSSSQSAHRYAKAKQQLNGMVLDLHGLDFDGQKHGSDPSAEWETIQFGHLFPEECYDGKALREKARSAKASPTDFYCRHFVKDGTLKGAPGIRWEAVFSIEGNRAKYNANRMLRRQGYRPPEGAYKVAERYGIYVCKDFIPVERANFILPGKGTEFLKFHAFFNCQAIQLSADRTSYGPTPPSIRTAINEQISEFIKEIFEDEGVSALLEALDEEDLGERTAELEKKDYSRRVKHAKGAKTESYKSVELRAPSRELGVVAMLAQLLAVSPELFPFQVLDWNNATGYDLLARDDSDLEYDDAGKFYVECKQILKQQFNHSLNNVKYIVCWDTDLQNGDIVTAVGGDTRTMVIKPKTDNTVTKFFLSRDDAPNNIEVFVLQRLLSEKLNIQFSA